MIPELTSAMHTPYPIPGLIKDLQTVSRQIANIGQHRGKENPMLLAVNQSSVAFYPEGYSSPPVRIRPGRATNSGWDLDVIIVDYWVDNDPASASGIMHQQHVALFKDREGVHAYTYSPPLDQKGSGTLITSSAKKFTKQAQQLWKAIGNAAELSLSHFPNIYRDYNYDLTQLFVSEQLLQHIVAQTQEHATPIALPNRREKRHIPWNVGGLRNRAA